jgi:hypothetical protein
VQAAPVAAHALCNALGFPDLGAVAEHARPRVVAAAFAAGMVAFAAGLDPLTQPRLFGNVGVDGGNMYVSAAGVLQKLHS